MKNHLETFTDDDLSAKMKASVLCRRFYSRLQVDESADNRKSTFEKLKEKRKKSCQTLQDIQN